MFSGEMKKEDAGVKIVKGRFGPQKIGCNKMKINLLQKMNVRDTVPLNED